MLVQRNAFMRLLLVSVFSGRELGSYHVHKPRD
jgi:hypothetical protein